ncbi:MAG TPA: hypothetical protein VGF69_12815 [Thermoanaerobaculia bacterium]|jgi:hypothetical protein
MKVRPLLLFTSIVSSILGAIVVYLILSVPNDLKADSLLKNARAELATGRNDKARQSLSTIVAQYPRTDAAAAATVALVTLADSERMKLERDLGTLRRENQQQTKLISDLQQSVVQIKATPSPAPVVIEKPAPAPKPAVKKPPAKKPAPKKRTTTRRRRG